MQKTAYELRISDWSSDVCSSDLAVLGISDSRSKTSVDSRYRRNRHESVGPHRACGELRLSHAITGHPAMSGPRCLAVFRPVRETRRGALPPHRSEEHTSELQSLMRISYADLCLENKKNKTYTLQM